MSSVQSPQSSKPVAHREPLYFEAGDHNLFGWLHRPDAPSSAGVGLVICKPFGYEAICAHRSLRAFADAAVEIGIPALRFDYLGTGDSGEIDPNADQLQVWSQDVIAAVGELQRRTGVEHVCLLGVRLGALLAVLAARQCRAITGLTLIAPVINGRRYLRELRTAVLASALRSDAPRAEGEPRADAPPASHGFMEVGGFAYSPATLSSLALVDLGSGSVAVSALQVIDGDTQPASRAWAEQMSRAGVRANYLALPGLIEMTMTAPQFASIPTRMIDAFREWLSTLAAAAVPSNEARSIHHDRAEPPIAAMNLPDGGSAEQALLVERPVFFAADDLLFGIVTEPRQDELRRRAVILLNAGADYHIGASGMYVGFARRWARRGYVVLRMDLAGLGDSGTRPGRPDNEIFPPAALEDIRAAIEFMQTRYGVTDVTLAGVCSGAYHALRAAVTSLPVNRILMVNPETFFWKEGMTVRDMQMAELVRNPTVYRNRMLSWAAWRKLGRGRVNVRYIARIYTQRAYLALESTLRDMARYLRIHWPGDLGWDLEQIGRRGVQVVFVFARGEPGIELLTILGGLSIKRLGKRCRVHIIDRADHVFSKSGPRAVLEKILSEELYSRAEWSAPPQIELNQSS